MHTSDPSPAASARVADLIKASPCRSAPLLVETTATVFTRDQSSLTMRAIGIRMAQLWAWFSVKLPL